MPTKSIWESTDGKATAGLAALRVAFVLITLSSISIMSTTAGLISFGCFMILHRFYSSSDDSTTTSYKFFAITTTAADNNKSEKKKKRSLSQPWDETKKVRVRSCLMRVAVAVDFTPLGGNRPDCAVLMTASVSLVEKGEPYLPPDVLDTAMAVLCAPVVIVNASSAMIPSPLGQGKGMLTCRLRPRTNEDVESFFYSEKKIFHEVERWNKELPWREFAEVHIVSVHLPPGLRPIECKQYFLLGSPNIVALNMRGMSPQLTQLHMSAVFQKLEMVRLPDSLTALGIDFLCNSMLRSIDLRGTRITTIPDCLLEGCRHLTEALFPDSLESVGNSFLSYCTALCDVDLSNTQLSSTGRDFLRGCVELRSVRLPDTLVSVGKEFLCECSTIQEIDLSNTQLNSIGLQLQFFSHCDKLRTVKLPETER